MIAARPRAVRIPAPIAFDPSSTSDEVTCMPRRPSAGARPNSNAVPMVIAAANRMTTLSILNAVRCGKSPGSSAGRPGAQLRRRLLQLLDLGCLWAGSRGQQWAWQQQGLSQE